MPYDDNYWMAKALELAQAGAQLGEVPVGALMVHAGEVVGAAHNRRESDLDPTAHAELLVIKAAAQHLGRWRLSGCTLYITLEPCPMCAGAIVNSRVDRVVFGATDPRVGAAGTVFSIVQDPRVNHRAELMGGVMADAAASLLQDFFRARRASLKKLT